MQQRSSWKFLRFWRQINYVVFSGFVVFPSLLLMHRMYCFSHSYGCLPCSTVPPWTLILRDELPRRVTQESHLHQGGVIHAIDILSTMFMPRQKCSGSHSHLGVNDRESLTPGHQWPGVNHTWASVTGSHTRRESFAPITPFQSNEQQPSWSLREGSLVSRPYFSRSVKT